MNEVKWLELYNRLAERYSVLVYEKKERLDKKRVIRVGKLLNYSRNALLYV